MILFENVIKKFNRIQVLDDINLHIEQGEKIALIGSNGAGKTTLIRCLLGEYNHQGSIKVKNIPTRKQRQQILSEIGFVPQLPPPLKMPVGQLIHFAAELCHSDPQRMKDVAERLGLDLGQLWKRPFIKLSGGQKQKLLIAIALGRDSRILILDEPAANLDPAARQLFFELLSEYPEDTVMLISSHRLDEVAALVNRVVEMDQGKVVLDDRVADSVALNSRLACSIRLTRHETAFFATLETWGFTHDDDSLQWTGQVSGADRLRFLGMLSRYAGLLAAINMEEINQ
ncbi:ABC transporter ATP-binding protein [Candidatus Venteria ishoeyi]|uniref:Arginine transport ATP-binding protein ArtM n=1 Tax=Candidatus Venteria ishoeyi TaxID=1899563 RepID=A0A1H6FHY7_9GAMM|nr:ABC transporter ATP-binding protein [Candidatus Venteria ishoeyi]MDM8547899.1 ABC transporter ATP-binding protein [Candidatus Venteria ishoeyi]SEH08989.1 Arginine transport ATP-binding protein ArtM [Candidatus Venteria ishoeyi]